MQTGSQIIEDAPDYIAVPLAMRHRRLELIFRPLDEMPQNEAIDERGWPSCFFERFAGCLADDLIHRHDQGEFEERLRPS